MRLMRQPCHLRLRLLIGKVLNTGKIILAEWAKLCLDPIFIMQRIGLEKVWRVRAPDNFYSGFSIYQRKF